MHVPEMEITLMISHTTNLLKCSTWFLNYEYFWLLIEDGIATAVFLWYFNMFRCAQNQFE